MSTQNLNWLVFLASFFSQGIISISRKNLSSRLSFGFLFRIS
jgi:hypothetical protein